MAKVYSSSTTAPVNIAVIKYWGKRDATLNLPTNSSISVTLSQDNLRAWTTASCSDAFEYDRMWLNGEERNTKDDRRLLACLAALRALRVEYEEEKSRDSNVVKLSSMGLHIASENNFPTAAGLASSAAGFAALVRAVADLYALPASPTVLSRIARQGSGSACRSLFGGYVAWSMGSASDGSDSEAVQVATAAHWPEMRACILVASAQKKDVSSTDGMQDTTRTSALFKARVETVVPDRMVAMTRAIERRDFPVFGELTMRDSNGFHAVCLDSYPPIFYMNDTSRACVRLVECVNRSAGRTVAAYTYDAGPNTVIYYLAQDEAAVLPFVKGALHPTAEGFEDLRDHEAREVPETMVRDTVRAGVTRVILTQIGDGPRRTEESVLGPDGFPKKSS